MVKALIDSSTLFDISRASKRRNAPWAQNTLRHVIAYQGQHPKLTISGLTVYELLDGLYRGGDYAAISDFHSFVLPSYEVIRPDAQIEDKAAEINAMLAKVGKAIGAIDTFIAATAIRHDLPLVNANTKHFPRIMSAGFPLSLINWRDV